MEGEYWFRLSRLSMMVIGSFTSYTKTKTVESAVWRLLTLDDGVETGNRQQVLLVQQVLLLLTDTSSDNGIEIPEHGSGSELFFFSFEQQ